MLNITTAVQNIEEKGYHVGYVVYDLSTGKELTYNTDEVIYGASTIKAPYVISLVRENPQAVSEDYEAIYKTLVNSSNDDYTMLWEKYDTDCMVRFFEDAGLEPELGKQKWLALSPRQLCMLWQQVDRDFNAGRIDEKIGKCMEVRGSAPIGKLLGAKYPTRTKLGGIAGSNDFYQAANDAGIVYAGDRPYIMVIMTTASAKFELLEPLILALDEAHQELVG